MSKQKIKFIAHVKEYHDPTCGTGYLGTCGTGYLGVKVIKTSNGREYSGCFGSVTNIQAIMEILSVNKLIPVAYREPANKRGAYAMDNNYPIYVISETCTRYKEMRIHGGEK